MPLLTITYNGFHGRVTKRVRGTCIQVSDRWNVKVSKSGAKRFGCPHKDCQCFNAIAELSK